LVDAIINELPYEMHMPTRVIDDIDLCKRILKKIGIYSSAKGDFTNVASKCNEFINYIES